MTYHFDKQELSILCEFMWSQSQDKVAEQASTNCNTLPYVNSTEEHASSTLLQMKSHLLQTVTSETLYLPASYAKKESRKHR